MVTTGIEDLQNKRQVSNNITEVTERLHKNLQQMITTTTLHSFNGLFSGQPGYQKGKPFWILMKQEMIG